MIPRWCRVIPRPYLGSFPDLTSFIIRPYQSHSHYADSPAGSHQSSCVSCRQPVYQRWSSTQVVSEETQGPESNAGADETSSFRQRESWGGAGGDPGHCEWEREGKLLADVASIFQLENFAKVGKIWRIYSSMHTIQLGASWILKHLVYFTCIYSIERAYKTRQLE